MKRLYLILFVAFLSVGVVIAQNATLARKILDKTASIVGRKGGASANFSISGANYGNTSGSIFIKGNKFHARTPQAIVWFNGKTQWTYLKRTNEVNVNTPNAAQQMSMNPYHFIYLYRQGYLLGCTSLSNGYRLHLKAQRRNSSIQEMYIVVNRNYMPSQIKMRQSTKWTTIRISNFKARNLTDGVFTFKSKDFPSAEIIDLR